MKSAIVFSAILALASAAILPPHPKSNSQNDMIPDNEYSGNYGNGNNEEINVREERNSIANSFDAVVDVMRQYKNDLANTNEFGNMENVISIPDTVTVGNVSDTYLTGVHVKGLKNFNSQNVTMSLEEDSVNAQNSWEKLTVNGVYHYINPTGRHSGVFEIVLVEPAYEGNTSLTKNANVYAMMSPASSVTFRKAVVNHSKLPIVFQNEKPEFDYFVKNVVCQYVATAVADNMYNEIVMSIRRSVRPYLTYQTGKIATNDAAAAAAPASFRYGNVELKNVRADNSKDNMAKINFAQMNNTNEINAAKVQLRLVDLAGESDYAVTAADGKNYGGKLAFACKTVRIVPTVNFNDKTVHTRVYVSAPRVMENKSSGNAIDSAAWADVEQQLTAALVEYFKQILAETVSRNIQNVL